MAGFLESIDLVKREADGAGHVEHHRQMIGRDRTTRRWRSSVGGLTIRAPALNFQA